MADNILKLKVESSEYDAKLKKAAEGIRHLADVAHQSGGELTGLEKAELDYVKALGEMETKSRTAAGSVRELENTYKELKVIYDQLNDVEKADEGGKALAASLERIKTRAQEARTQLENASKSLSDNGQEAQQSSSALDALASKFTINIDAIKLFNIGVQAAGTALDVAKDAFMSSETNVDEWGRTIRSAEGVYQSFLQSLNTSDFSGFLNNIGQVTQAAREAYNALDELGTRMTIINPERAKLQARQQELRADIRRNGADSEIGKAALAELKKIEPLLSKSYKTESQMNYTAFEKLVRERLAEGGINLNQKSFNEFMKTFSNDAAFQSLRKNARGSSELRETSEIGKFRTVDTRNTEQKLLDLFTDEWRQANSGYLTASFSAQGAAASNALGNARYMKAGGTKGGTGSGSGSGSATTTTGIKDEFTVMEELVGLIPVAEQKVKDLQQQIRESWDEGEIEKLREDLKLAQAELDRLNGKAQDIDLNKLFPDMSKQKYNTGYAGSIQSKIDSARQDMAMGPLNIETVNSYIGIMKNALKDADFGTDIYNSLSESMKDATTMSTLLQELMKRGMDGADLSTVAENFKSALLDGDIPDDDIREYIEKLNEKIREAGGVELAYNDKTGEVSGKKEEKKNDEFKEFNQKAGAFISGLSSVSNGLKGLGLQLPEGVDQLIGAMSSVMQVIQGVNTIISVFSTSALVANTAAVNANTFALLARSFGFGLFANGGVVHAANGWSGNVPGTSYSGDNIPIMVNSGELILNRAQQGNIASQLEGGGLGDLQLELRVDAEDFIIMLNNNGKRRGLGRLING